MAPNTTSSSSTGCGSTPARGSPGWTYSPSRDTGRALPGGPATWNRSPRRERSGRAERPGNRRDLPPLRRDDRQLDEKPIVIGHSFGGLIAQELLANDLVARPPLRSSPAPIKGVKVLPFAQLKSGFPVLGNPANKSRTVALKDKQFKYSIRQRANRRRIGCAARGVDHPGTGAPSVRRCHGELRAQFACRGGHA